MRTKTARPRLLLALLTTSLMAAVLGITTPAKAAEVQNVSDTATFKAALEAFGASEASLNDGTEGVVQLQSGPVSLQSANAVDNGYFFNFTDDLTLDLNGQELQLNGVPFVVQGSGSLEIINTDGAETGKISTNTTGKTVGTAVQVGSSKDPAGKLILTDGTITNEGTGSADNAVSITGTASFTMSNGTVTASKGSAIAVVMANPSSQSVPESTAPSVTVGGGTVTGGTSGIWAGQAGKYTGPITGGTATISVTGGTVTGGSAAAISDNVSSGTLSVSGQAKLEGGTAGAILTSCGNASVSGGEVNGNIATVFSGSTTISNGTVKGNVYNGGTWNDSDGTGENGTTVITGGTVTGTVSSTSGSLTTGSGANITGSNGPAVQVSGGKASIGGTITSNFTTPSDPDAGTASGAVLVSGGDPVTISGTVSNDKGNAVSIQGGTVSVSGANISGGGTSNEKPGQAMRVSDGTVTIGGGTTIKPVGTDSDTGLYAPGGNVTIGNATISGGEYGAVAGGPKSNGSTLTVTEGANISGSTAGVGVSSSANSGTNLNVEGGTITGTNGGLAVDNDSTNGTVKLEGGVINGGVNTNGGTTDVGKSGQNAGPTVNGPITNENGETNAYGGSFNSDATESLSSAQQGGITVGSPLNEALAPDSTNKTSVTATSDDGTEEKYLGTTKPNLVNSDVDKVTVDSIASGDKSTLQVNDETDVINNTDTPFDTQSPSSNGPVEVPAHGSAIPGAPEPEPEPEPGATPGDSGTIQGQVVGVKNPIVNSMAPYASVAANSSLTVWNVTPTETGGSTPVATVANDLIARVVGAMARGGSPSASSVQDPKIAISLANSTVAEQQAFSLQVLEAAVPIQAQAVGSGATLSDLVGMTCGVTCKTNQGTLTYTFNFLGTEPAPEPEPEPETVDVYRIQNPVTNQHLYTADMNEYTYWTNNGWVGENVAWTAPATSDRPIYRLRYVDGGHLYTADPNEYSHLDATADWIGEGIAMYSAPATDVPVYRLFDPTLPAGDAHLWTADFNEYTYQGNHGWNREDVAFYAITAPGLQ